MGRERRKMSSIEDWEGDWGRNCLISLAGEKKGGATAQEKKERITVA